MSEGKTPLEKAYAKLNKRFGTNLIHRFQETDWPEVECIPTGSPSLNLTIGYDRKFLGIPRGKVSILFGPKGCGKSTHTFHIMANAQKMGLTVALADVEQSFDPVYAAACGVNVNEVLFIDTYDTREKLGSKPNEDYGTLYPAEDMYEIIETLVRTGEIGLIVLDSEDNLRCRAEMEGEYGEANWGKKALVNTQFASKIVGPLKATGTALLVVKQVRAKMDGNQYDPNDMSGGKAWKHACSLRIDLTRGKQEGTKVDPLGKRPTAKIIWNKIHPPMGRCQFLILYGEGISKEDDILDLGIEYGILAKRGTYYAWQETGETIAQGKANARAYLKEKPDIADGILEQVEAIVHEQNPDPREEEADPEDAETEGD